MLKTKVQLADNLLKQTDVDLAKEWADQALEVFTELQGSGPSEERLGALQLIAFIHFRKQVCGAVSSGR